VPPNDTEFSGECKRVRCNELLGRATYRKGRQGLRISAGASVTWGERCPEGACDRPRILSGMTAEGWWLIGGAAALVIFVFAEGRCQARRYGPPSARPNLLGVGMLEVQRHLQADRHVEVLQKQNKAEQEAVEEQGVGAGRSTDEGETVKQH
jgi:hypothetical protein